MQKNNEHNLATQAFKQLYPEKEVPQMELSYSARFSAYNANVHFDKRLGKIQTLQFRLSREFKETSEEIQIGIIQELLNKVFKTNTNTLEQELYTKFVKQLTKYTPAKKSDVMLKELFNELNEEYFSEMMEQPTLVFGNYSFRTLGHYTFAQDKVTISKVLKEERELCKFVLYHELLHKKHHFEKRNGRTISHSRIFREEERKYADKQINEKLERFIRNYRRKKIPEPLRRTNTIRRKTTSPDEKNDKQQSKEKKRFIQQLIDAFLE